MAPQWEGLNVVAQTVTGTQGSIIKLNRTPCNGVQPPTPQLKLERDHWVLLSESWVQEVGIRSRVMTRLCSPNRAVALGHQLGEGNVVVAGFGVTDSPRG